MATHIGQMVTHKTLFWCHGCCYDIISTGSVSDQRVDINGEEVQTFHKLIFSKHFSTNKDIGLQNIFLAVFQVLKSDCVCPKIDFKKMLQNSNCGHKKKELQEEGQL